MGKAKTIGRKIGVGILRLILLGNLVAIALLWACCATTQIVPAEHPTLALTGLLFPGFLLLVLVFIPIWLVLKKRWVLVPILGIAACYPYVMDYCPVNFSQEVPEGALKVVTWNCNYMSQWDANRDSLQNIGCEYLQQIDADIICLQEMSEGSQRFMTFADEMKQQGFYVESNKGGIIISRFPILKQEAVEYESASNGSACFYLQQDNGDTLLLVNNHLESNHLEMDAKTEYVESLDDKDYDRLNLSGHTIGAKVRTSTVIRGPQADSLAMLVQRNEDKNIVMCGDYNDTPISYVYQKINSTLKNAFRESGRGIGISYNQRGFWVRIDHIFVSQNIKTYHTYIDSSIDISDHYPLITWIEIQ